jgi:hypothetical protein
MTTETAVRKAVEFYTIELALLAGGGYGVSVVATTVDDEEPQLLSQEITSTRVASIDDVLVIIRGAVAGTAS